MPIKYGFTFCSYFFNHLFMLFNLLFKVALLRRIFSSLFNLMGFSLVVLEDPEYLRWFLRLCKETANALQSSIVHASITSAMKAA